MTSILTFEVSLPYRELSSNGSHGHWRRVAEARRLYRIEARIEAHNAAREQGWRMSGRATVDLLFGIRGGRRVQRYQPRDVGNAISAAKALFDGMVDAGVVADDSRQHLAIGAVSISSDLGPFVRVTVREV